MLIAHPLLRLLALVFVASAMLSLGLQTTPGEIREVLRDRRFTARALLANLLFAPALGVIVAILAPVPREVQLGITLIALAPGAPFGLQFTRMVKGRAAFAIGLVLLLTTLSLIYTPVAVALLLPLEAPIRLPYGRILSALLLYMALPAAAGLALRWRAPKLPAALAKPLFLLTTVAFVTLMLLSGELKRAAFRAIGGVGVAAMLAFIAGAMLIGWALGGPDAGHRRVLAAGTSTRNVIISQLIASRAFPSGTVEVVVLAFLALAVPANLLVTLGAVGYAKWRHR